MSKTILVVEDEILVREMTVDFLEEADMVVDQAATADEALQILESRAVEICLMFTDVRMPGELDGLDLTRVVMARWPHIKIIVTSGIFSKNSDVLPHGTGFLAKPWQPLDMIAKITRAARHAC